MSVKLEMQTTSKEIMEALEKIIQQLEEQGVAKEEIEEKIDIIEEDIKQQIKSIQTKLNFIIYQSLSTSRIIV